MYRKKKNKLLKDIEARIPPIIVFILIILATLTSVFVIFPMNNIVRGDYSDFGYYKLITIESDYVDEDLINFPVWVYNVSDDFKDTDNGGVIQPDGDDIAFFSYDRSTQYNHEIEVYNGTTGTIGIWVNITSISHTVDTQFWIYYNDTDGTNQENIPDTWDNDYIAVWHMVKMGSKLIDSAGGNGQNYHNGTAMSLQGYNITGCGGGLAMDFERDNNRYVDITEHPSDFGGFKNLTIFTIHKPESWSDVGSQFRHMIHTNDGSGNEAFYYSISGFNNDKHLAKIYFSSSSEKSAYYGADPPVAEWTSGCMIHNITNATWYYNGELSVDTTGIDETIGESGWSPTKITIGSSTSHSESYDGYVDEIRISNIARSAVYVNVSWISVLNVDTFLTFGEETEGGGDIFTLNGLDGDDRITWYGEAGDIVWSNQTYPGGTLQITVNTTNNCTEVRIQLEDISVSQGILKTNISIICDDDNSSWTGNVVGYTGTNFTINETTWTTNSWGGSPFPIDNDEISIYLRFRLSIPSDANANVYTVDTWKVWYKIEE